MVFNPSDLFEKPVNTTMSPFTGFFDTIVNEGMIFYLIPLSIIAIALYFKTKEPAVVGLFMITSGALLSTGNIFAGAIPMAIVYAVFAGIGLGALVISVILGR